MNMSRLVRRAFAAGLLSVLCSRGGLAQSCSHLRCYSAAEALRLFEAEAGEHRSGSGHAAALYILTKPDVPVQRRDSVADGLESLVLRAENLQVRMKAVTYLTQAGAPAEGRVVLPSAAHRIKRIYRESTDLQVRSMVLLLIFRMGDRPNLIPLLREVAERPGVTGQEMMFNHDPDEASLAVEALAHMGEEGRGVLRELHRTRRVRSARAEALLENLARRNFQVSAPSGNRQ